MRGVERVVRAIRAGDAALGAQTARCDQRPDRRRLQAKLDAARRLQLARDRWALRAPVLTRYRVGDRRRRSSCSRSSRRRSRTSRRSSGSTPATLDAIRSRRVAHARAGVRDFAAATSSPPRTRCSSARSSWPATPRGFAARRRSPATCPRAWDASSAAAGALMLGARARDRYPDAAEAAATPVITPRRTRLVRVPDLQSSRHAIHTRRSGCARRPCIRRTGRQGDEPRVRGRGSDARRRAAARRERSPPISSRATSCTTGLHGAARESAAAADAARTRRHRAGRGARRAAAPAELSFQLRPGLVAEMLRFYDQLRRQSQQVKRFEELIDEALGCRRCRSRGARACGCRRGSSPAHFASTSAACASRAPCDEHTLRERLIAEAAADPRAPRDRHRARLDRRCRGAVPGGFRSADAHSWTRVRSTSCRPSACSRPGSTSGCTRGGRGWRRSIRQVEAAARAVAHPMSSTPSGLRRPC